MLGVLQTRLHKGASTFQLASPGRSSYLSEHGVVDGAQVDRPFVGQVVENVERPGRFGSLLLVAKDEIDPLVQLAGDKLALQSLEGRAGGTENRKKMSRDGGR